MKRILYGALGILIAGLIWFGNQGEGSRKDGTQGEGIRSGVPTKDGAAEDTCPVSEGDRILALSRMWGYAKDFYPNWDLTDEEMDWDREYLKAAEKMKQVKSRWEYLCVLDEFRALLRDGHGDGTLLQPFYSNKGLNGLGVVPLYLDYVEGQYVIEASANPEEIPVGSIVEEIDGIPALSYMEMHVGTRVGLRTPLAREYRMGNLFRLDEPGKTAELTLVNPNGTQKKAGVSWGSKGIPNRWEYKKIGTKLYESDVISVWKTKENICHVAVRTFKNDEVTEEFYKKVLPIVEQAEGVILDFRKNGGGNSSVGKAILQMFSEKPIPDAGGNTTIKVGREISLAHQWRELLQDGSVKESKELRELIDRGESMRKGTCILTEEQYLQVMEILLDTEVNRGGGSKAESPYIPVPCVVLIDHTCGSAVDTTAAMAKSAGFMTVGSRTLGCTGNNVKFDLGNGYSFSMTTQYAVTPEGEPMNNRGIEAELYVEQTLADKQKKIDTQLEAAYGYLLGQKE